MPSQINNAFMRLSRRAEANEHEKLVDTFVEAGPLMTLLSSRDHQVVYGRRGTGKTHALTYLTEDLDPERNVPLFIDLRTVGSTGGLYGNTEIPLSERGTRLLMDALIGIHDQLTDYALENPEDPDLSRMSPALSRFREAITRVTVIGEVEREVTETQASRTDVTSSMRGAAGSQGANVEMSSGREETDESRETGRYRERGEARHRVVFGEVGAALQDLVDLLENRHLWVILDEWVSIPLELQPYLADLLRRALFPVRGLTVKIAAIEQRSRFRLPAPDGDYLGIELGADIAADVNLDDFMVFENDEDRAKEFFRKLLHRHVSSVDGVNGDEIPETPQELVREGFTQRNTFEEFVRAAEGVPRDGINIISLAAQRALDRPITMGQVRAAAQTWYQRDKEAAVRANARAHDLLHWIIDEVIGERQARAFLLRKDVEHPLVDTLFDERVLHILKRSISAHDQPGVRYDAYKLDYGCYVDLITTAREPQGLLPLGEDADGKVEDYVEVPPDDYRSIRRAILDLDEFEAAMEG